MSGKKTFYTYQLIDSRDDTTFYIGKGTGKRMYQHVALAKKGIRINEQLKKRILNILESGFKIQYKKVFETQSEFEAYRKEAELIESYGLNNLCNVAKAGPNWSDMDCEKLRQHLSEIQRGEKNYWYGNSEHSKNMSQRLVEKYGTHITPQCLAAAKKVNVGNKYTFGKTHSQETKEKMSIAAKKRTKNSMTGRHHSKETKEKIRKKLKKII